MTGVNMIPAAQKIKPCKFVYVFSIKDRDALLKLGFEMLCEDNVRGVFVFQNTPDLFPDDCDVEYITTNRLFF